MPSKEIILKAAEELKAHPTVIKWWAQADGEKDWLRISDCMMLLKRPWAKFLLSGDWKRITGISCIRGDE